jgi:hypothetical protein
MRAICQADQAIFQWLRKILNVTAVRDCVAICGRMRIRVTGWRRLFGISIAESSSG